MNCQHARILIHGYVDGELDLVRSLELERHLRNCRDCAQAYDAQLALRAAINTGSLAYAAPARLQQRVRTSLRQQGRTNATPRRLPWRWLSLAAALLIVAIVAGALAYRLRAPGVDDRVAEAVFDSHVRSLMANHLTDVASSDQHTVKPWFDGKLDFSPAVVDLKGQGFPLIGGRLDYLDNRPVAALVYHRRLHVINLFIWPAAAAAAAPHDMIQQGYQLLSWHQGAMTYWAVSDVSADDLQAFVQLYRQQAELPATQ
ncbi:MAG: anti-sigma factor [Roseiflexaceae bacterium]